MRLNRFRYGCWVYVLLVSTCFTVVPPAFLASHLGRYTFNLNDEESDAAETDADGESRPEKEVKADEEKWLHDQWQLSLLFDDHGTQAWHHRPEDANYEFPSKEIHSPPPEHKA